MRAALSTTLVLLACVATASAASARAFGQAPAAQVSETIAEVRVHGNHATSNDDVLALAGLVVGERFEATTLALATERLKKSGRFDDVEVLKRYASIADPSRIAVVIVVNEGPIRLVMPDEDDPDGVPRVVRRRLGNFMWLPILSFDDGYGASYGARVAYVGLGTERRRLSFPLAWGGRRRAGIDFSHTYAKGPVSHVEFGAVIQQEENPAFEERDTRRKVWGRVEHVTGPFQAGASLGWQRVDFAGARDRIGSVGARDRIRSVGANVAFDTRLNPVMPRNAVLARAAWERLDISGEGVVHQVRLDGEAYLGLVAQSVLAVRIGREDASRPVPLYLRSLLGGWSNLRGFEAGAFTGDTMVTATTELLMPLSSPLSVGQVGLSAFVDSGTAYDKGERLADQRWHVGYGGSVWFTVTAFRMSLAVAHGRGASTRVHLSGGFSF